MLISCFVAFFVMVGMVNSTSSLFIVPVCDTYGFSRAAFSVTISLCSLGSAIINIFYGKIYQRFGIRKMVGTGFIVGGIAFLVMTKATSLPVFYLGGILASVGLGLDSTTTMALLINSWFKEKQGVLIGFVSASSGLGGFLFSSLFAVLIANHGYQSAYLFTAITLLAVSVPMIILIREKEVPDNDTQDKPQGAKMGGAGYFAGFAKLLHDRSVRLSLICTFIIGLIIHGIVVSSSAHLQLKGIDEITAGIIYGGIYFSMGVFKIVMGYIHDKMGIRLAAITGMGGFIISVILLMFVSSPAMGWLYVVFAGMGTATESVLTPLLAHNVLGENNYKKYLGIFSAALTSGIAAGVPIISAVYDMFRTYVPGFIAYCAIAAVVLYLIMISIHDKYSKPVRPE